MSSISTWKAPTILIDYKLKVDDKEYEVTPPFINSLYHSNETFAFANVFFNQVL